MDALHLLSGHPLRPGDAQPIVAKTGITRSSLYRHLPPRPAELLTAAAADIDVTNGCDASAAPIYRCSAPSVPALLNG